jgi:hypothetical protein
MTEKRHRTRAMRVAVALNAVLLSTAVAQRQNEAVPFARYLRESAVPKSVIDTFLSMVESPGRKDVSQRLLALRRDGPDHGPVDGEREPACHA